MRSGGEISHFSSASRPFTAVVTEKPAFFSETSITRSDLGSPSTRSRCCFAKCASFGAFSRPAAPGPSGRRTPSESRRRAWDIRPLLLPALEQPELPDGVGVPAVRGHGGAEVLLRPGVVLVVAG